MRGPMLIRIPTGCGTGGIHNFLLGYRGPIKCLYLTQVSAGVALCLRLSSLGRSLRHVLAARCRVPRARAIAGNLAEIAFGFWDPGGGPAQDQCAACQGSPPTSCLA